jgi:hypothetical protein
VTDRILVFRLSSKKGRGLAGVNAASFYGVIEFAYKAIDKEVSHGDTLEVFRVEVEKYGEYELFRRQMNMSRTPHGHVGRKKTGWGFWYSFPKDGPFKARKIGSATLDDLGKVAGWTPDIGRTPGWWYISEIPIDQEHKAAEKAFGLRIPKG